MTRFAAFRRLIRHPLRSLAERAQEAWNSDLHHRIVSAVHHPIRSMRAFGEALRG
jgi:hypothetical protein